MKNNEIHSSGVLKARRETLTLLCLGFLLLFAGSGSASAQIRRYALAAGANYGGPDRTTLRYAVSDAESFARVMETLGGVYSSDLVLLKQPSLIELEDALEELRHKVDSSSESERTQIMVYYSGHADETGLLLGEELFSYRSLRNWMDLVDADVRIAVLDACASGTITRLKGTRRRSAFLVDASTEMQGHAFLTSSSADESAQESDRIGGSFFTHYLVSGLRGAADVSGEGKVTLNEAYQFAFSETLGRTTETQAGAQHPSYDIDLSGTGEVVMTDVRETSAVLVLSEDLAAFLFGGKRYFPGLGGLSPNIKPFLSAAVGPYYRNATPQDVGTVSGVAAGGNVGGGFDIQPARWCMVDVKLGYNFTSDFTSDFTGTFGEKTSYSGFELAIGFSVLLGKGNTPDS